MSNPEQSRCSCSYGGTSWAMRPEIEFIAKKLALQPGQHLLDLGAGTGWPGLYLATLSGCDLSLTDHSRAGLDIALKRAKIDKLPGKCTVATADARDLPYDDDNFHAITHSDVLCCLAGKQQVLAECRRVIRADGQMIFSVISIDQGAGDTDNAKIIQYGPPNIDIVAKTSYEEMLGLTGWNITQKIDQSAQFLESIKIHLKDIRRKKADLAPELGDEDYKFSNEKYTTYLDCISRGVMRRDIYVASFG